MDEVFVAIGSNLPDAAGRVCIDTCRWAVDRLRHLTVVRRVSRFYRSAPVPASAQPDYVNGVVALEATMTPEALLASLHAIEAEAGRRRTVANAARVLDLDLLAVGGQMRSGAGLELPHPRLHERAFVLLPLCDVAPEWRHPRLGRTAASLLSELPRDLLSPVRAIT